MRTIRSGWTFLALVLALASATVGCGSGSSTVDVGTTVYPTGSTDVVLRVASCCGFTPVEYQLGIVPTVAVYGDGRVILAGPVTEQYPPHALPNLLTGRLSADAVASLVARAERAGLLSDLDFGEPSIADASTTVVTVFTDHSVTSRVYALGFGDGSDGGGVPGITTAQRETRARVATFVEELTAAATDVAREPYAAESVALYVRPAEQSTSEDPIPPGHAVWPLGDLATFGEPLDFGPGADSPWRCGVLTGTDATTALAAAASATSITRWDSAATEYSIVWRPLLPDETSCPTTTSPD